MGRTADKQDWDVRTNISASPGAQGTLFSGGKKYASDKRYPRGYTPERLADVKDSVDTSNASVSWGQQRTLEALHGHEKAKFVGDFGEPNRRLIDAVARSTVPTDKLMYTDESGNKDDVIRFTTGHPTGSLGEGIAGHYVSRQLQEHQGNPGSRPVIAVTKGSEDSPTIIHEIGHHVDSEERGYHYHHTANPVGMGEAEGRADAYADTHYRNRSGRAEKKWNYNGDILFPGDTERTNAFQHGYVHGRHTGLKNESEASDGPSFWDSIRTPEDQHAMFGIATSPKTRYEFGPGGDKPVGVDHDYRFYSNLGESEGSVIGRGETFEAFKKKR